MTDDTSTDDNPPTASTSAAEVDSVGDSSESTTDGSTSDSGGITLDSPVAASTSISASGSNDDAVYGSRTQRLQERVEQHTEDADGTADDTDVRQLFQTPTVDEIRWQYRQNGIAATVVDKPIKDAFKYGVSFDSESFDTWYSDEYQPTQQTARIKARRDGFALVFWVLEDSGSIHESPSDVDNVDGVADLRVLTLGDLAVGEGDPRNNYQERDEVATGAVAAPYFDEFDEDELTVTRSGLVLVDNITRPEHEDFLGVVYERNPYLADDGSTYEFIHADRLDLYVSRPTVDGDVHNSAYGFVEGDSVLAPIYHALTGITKAEWALGQTLLRYTAPLHAVEIDKDVQPSDGSWEDHIESLNEQLDNLNNKSNLTLPPGHSVETHGLGSEIDPEPFLVGLVNDICAGSEFTKSVLFGTQTGTVSGSSTDIKNYFNQVERYRDDDAVEKQRTAARKADMWVDDVSIDADDVDPEWGPLFKIDELDRLEGMRTLVSTVGSGVGNYVLTVDEARDLIEDLADTVEADVQLDELTEDDLDQLDRVNTAKGKQYPEGVSAEQEVDPSQSPRQGQNNGGREGGQTTDPSNPTEGGRETNE